MNLATDRSDGSFSFRLGCAVLGHPITPAGFTIAYTNVKIAKGIRSA